MSSKIKRFIVSLVATSFLLVPITTIATTTSASASTNYIPSPQLPYPPLYPRGFVCMMAGAKIGADGKTVTCPHGRQYRAHPGMKFVVRGDGIYEVPSGGILGPDPWIFFPIPYQPSGWVHYYVPNGCGWWGCF